MVTAQSHCWGIPQPYLWLSQLRSSQSLFLLDGLAEPCRFQVGVRDVHRASRRGHHEGTLV